jgi:hypothetical protein
VNYKETSLLFLEKADIIEIQSESLSYRKLSPVLLIIIKVEARDLSWILIEYRLIRSEYISDTKFRPPLVKGY